MDTYILCNDPDEFMEAITVFLTDSWVELFCEHHTFPVIVVNGRHWQPVKDCYISDRKYLLTAVGLSTTEKIKSCKLQYCPIKI